MFGSMSFTWLVVMVILLIVEAMVPGLVSLWFAAGALAAMVAALLKAPAWLQLVLFVVVSVVSLFMMRPIAKKYVNAKVQPTNADAVIGKECLVTETINNILGTGAVKVGGKVWTAVSCDDSVIEKDSRVTAVEIRGVKLAVKPLKADE